METYGFTSTKVVPTKETTNKSVLTPTQGILVYSRNPSLQNLESLTPRIPLNMGDPLFPIFHLLLLMIAGCLNYFVIMGYGDSQMGNITISRVYYVEGLGHNLFFVGQFCDFDLEVAFQKHTCFIRDLEGVDLLKGSRGLNLYTLSMENVLLSSPMCLLSKASKTKSWLWHQRLSHLNLDYITSLTKQGLVQGLPKLKYQKDHLCSACALGKSKKNSHKPKSVDSIQEKLYLLHMDLYGLMRIQIPAVIALEPAVSTGTPSSMTIDQDAPSTNNNPYVDFLILEPSYEESSTQVVIPNNVHLINQPLKHINKWSKDHLIDNVIGNPSRPVSTRQQLQDEALLCYFDAFLSFVKPRSYKDTLTKSCSIKSMQEELNEFKHLEVWELVPRPDCVMVITLKWIYKVKLD
ncbi:integrase, catalytic region, zinc finger, CCHC-type containing protein [Tanacetum coccineum]